MRLRCPLAKSLPTPNARAICTNQYVRMPRFAGQYVRMCPIRTFNMYESIAMGGGCRRPVPKSAAQRSRILSKRRAAAIFSEMRMLNGRFPNVKYRLAVGLKPEQPQRYQGEPSVKGGPSVCVRGAHARLQRNHPSVLEAPTRGSKGTICVS